MFANMTAQMMAADWQIALAPTHFIIAAIDYDENS